MKFIGIIPARYASTRFPGKPLAMIDGNSMIMRVYQQAIKATCFTEVMVATDDERIFEHVNEQGGKVVMTSTEHRSGTDRINEVISRLIEDDSSIENSVVINIQGDEPFIHPGEIERLANCFQRPEVNIATLIKKISDPKELFDQNVVKVICGKSRQALYFSRTPLPFIRGVDASSWISEYSFYKHIGIYAYRANVLKEIAALHPSKLEMAEGLEQLRWLENGFDIFTEETDYESISVDTPEDLLKLTNKL
jgi:3-deoxy-manno-octulosonate cytidylyltransferase (CMP-KDO synthetase)